MIRRILVDMDGVLVNFFEPALALWGFELASYPRGQWEIADVLGIGVNDFWARIDEQTTFWRDLKPYPWATKLLNFLDATNIPWTVATSPSRNPQCLAQKVEWMRQHIAPGFGNYMIGKHKHLMANPDTLLIDDGEHNVDPFISAGGKAVLWPMVWNRGGEMSDPFEFVRGEVCDKHGVRY